MPDPTAPTTPAPATPTPAAAWRLLASGNARFVDGTPRHPHASHWRRQDLTAGQHPFAAVLSCADSRVSPELVFDRGLGDLFVVRTAGHVLDDVALGSLEYGVLHVGTPLLAVLGHEDCGCVAATIAAAESGIRPGGHVGTLVDAVMPGVQAARDTGTICLGEIMEEHVRRTMRGLLDRSPALADAVHDGRVALVGLTYRLTDGAVRLLDWVGDLTPGTDLEGGGRQDAARAERRREALAAQEMAANDAVVAATRDPLTPPLPTQAG